MMEASSSEQYDPSQLMNEADTAKLLCQSIRTVQKWRVTGFGPAFYKIGRSVRYRRHDILEWVTARRAQHTSAY